ncbi:hypothetical protein Daus18300_013710 [Diaporthe australafricana]|uniref:Uncharacterized protein n=1 Tax=Diaporthe australafricana TaxID=127596 RepID=A0ABR3VXX4_9PEZI
METSDTGRLANPEAPLQTPHDVEEPSNLSIDIESMERQTFPESYYDATHELGLNDFDISTDEPSTVSGIVDPAQAERDMCGPRDFVGITFDFDSPNNHRIAQDSVMLAQTNDQPPCFSDVLDSSTSTQLPSVQFDYDASVSNFEAMGSARTDSDAYFVKDKPDMDGRFEGLLEYSRAMGFDSFDSLVTAYYSHNFDVSSPLATVQRLSRNRHLPKVLADVLDAAKGWSDWERHGLHAEIMKQAESILVSEADRASSALNVSIDQFVEAQDPARISPITAGTVLGVRRTIEREVCVSE